MSAGFAPSVASEGRSTVAVAALITGYLQAVNISLPNAALLHMQGSLSMADDEVGWIFTSYIVASLVTAPMARWLAGRFGRKLVFQTSIAVFVVGLILAARADTSTQLIAARVVQGAASGLLGPLSLAILFDITPPARQARIGPLWAVTTLLGLLSGPSIGGWLSEYHGWPSLFYVGLPVAAFVFLAMALTLPDKRAERSPPFDFFGLATFSIGLVGLQMALDRGERMEWFESGEIWAEAAASAVGFYLYLAHVLTANTHFLDKALFRDRNFVVSTALYFAVGFVLLPTIALTSPMLDELLNYPPDTTGYMAAPRSLALIGALVLAGRLPPRVDNRLLVVGGIILIVFANWRMLGYSPLMDWSPVIVAGVVQGAGLGLMIEALGKTAFSTLDPAFRPEGTALFNLARFYGGTIGIGLVLDFFYDNTQAMHLALAKDLVPNRVAAHVAGSLPMPKLAMLNEAITGQAAFVGIVDQFKVMVIPMLILSPLALCLRKPRMIG